MLAVVFSEKCKFWDCAQQLNRNWWLSGKESRCQAGGRISGLGRFPWRRKLQPSPLFLPGKSHGQRSLAGYSLWGRKRIRHDLGTKQLILSTLTLLALQQANELQMRGMRQGIELYSESLLTEKMAD